MVFNTRRNRLLTKHDIDGGGDDVLDTGWRDVSDDYSLPPASVLIRRQGCTVTVSLNPGVTYPLDLATALNGQSLPTPFCNGFENAWVFFPYGDDGGGVTGHGSLATGVMNFTDAPVGGFLTGCFSFTTDFPFPTTLPGTAYTP